MAKILLFRVGADLSATLVSELARGGYDVLSPESADVRTVLQHQPDLILLQTDVRTLDCCGLLTQIKGNEATAPVKIILLTDGGSLERSHALDLGADDVLSIPFEQAELFARIRAELREKAPDDRLRLELVDARKKELEAEAALATIVAQKETGKRRWIALGVVTLLALIGVVVAIRNSQVSKKSNASLVLQLANLRSEILTQGQLLERAQKTREALNQDLTSRVGKLENESRVAQDIVRDYSDSVCLIYAMLGFFDRKTGAQLKFTGNDANGNPSVDAKGNVLVTTSGNGPPVHMHVFGSGFLIDSAGHILTNHHVLQPWWHNTEAIPVPTATFEPKILTMRAYFPGNETSMPVHVQGLSEEFDLGLATVELPDNPPKPVSIEDQAAISGSPSF